MIFLFALAMSALAQEPEDKSIMDSCGGKFILKSHGVGKFGRCLGTIYVHGENINERLITEGYAVRYKK